MPFADMLRFEAF